MKRFLSIILAVVLCVSLALSLASCSFINAEADYVARRYPTPEEVEVFEYYAETSLSADELYIASVDLFPECFIWGYEAADRSCYAYFVSTSEYGTDSVVAISLNQSYTITEAAEITQDENEVYSIISLIELEGIGANYGIDVEKTNVADYIKSTVMDALSFISTGKENVEKYMLAVETLGMANGSTYEVTSIYSSSGMDNGITDVFVDRYADCYAVLINTYTSGDPGAVGVEVMVVIDGDGTVRYINPIEYNFASTENAANAPGEEEVAKFFEQFVGIRDSVANAKPTYIPYCEGACEDFACALQNSFGVINDLKPTGFDAWVYRNFGPGADPTLAGVGLAVVAVVALIVVIIVAIVALALLAAIILLPVIIIIIIIIAVSVSKKKKKKKLAAKKAAEESPAAEVKDEAEPAEEAAPTEQA